MKMEERPKSELTSNEARPMIIQSKSKKNSDWPEIPKSAVIVEEFDLSEQGY